MLIFMLFVIISPAHAQFSIELNPSGTTPLSALITSDSPMQDDITVIVQGKSPEDSIGSVHSGSSSEIPVHGLYMGYTNTITLASGGKTLTNFTLYTEPMSYVTKPLPNVEGERTDRPFTIKTEVIISNPRPDNMFNKDLYFTSFNNAYYIVGWDDKGDMRYMFYNKDKERHPRLVHMEEEDGKIYMIYIDNNRIYNKIDLMGNTIFTADNKGHHDVIKYKDGIEIILGVSQWGWDDVIFEIDSNQNVIKTLDFGTLFRNAADPEDQHLIDRLVYDEHNKYISEGKPVRVDWAHANALVYDPYKDILYVSLRHLGVIAVDYSEWDLIWWMADDKLKTFPSLKYSQKPDDLLYLKDIPSLQKYRMQTKAGEGPRGQHSLLLKKNGNMIMFDNRSQGETNPEGSRVVEYAFDDMNASLVREFIDENKTYSRYTSDVDLSGQNLQNWLIYYGQSAPTKRIIEINPLNEVVYQMDIHTPSITYRIDKFPLYPYRDKTKKYSIDY